MYLRVYVITEEPFSDLADAQMWRIWGVASPPTSNAARRR